MKGLKTCVVFFIIFCFLAVALLPSVNAATIFEDDFESGLVNWVNEGSPSAVLNTDHAHGGQYSLLCPSGESAHCYMTISPERPAIHARFYLNIGQLPENGQDDIAIIYANNGLCYLSLNRDDDGYFWSLFNNVIGAQYNSDYVTLSAGTWYCVEFSAVVNPTAGAFTLWVNEEQLINRTGINTGSDNIIYVTLGNADAGHGRIDRYYDDFAVADTYIGSEPENYSLTFSENITMSSNLAAQKSLRRGISETISSTCMLVSQKNVYRSGTDIVTVTGMSSASKSIFAIVAESLEIVLSNGSPHAVKTVTITQGDTVVSMTISENPARFVQTGFELSGLLQLSAVLCTILSENYVPIDNALALAAIGLVFAVALGCAFLLMRKKRKRLASF